MRYLTRTIVIICTLLMMIGSVHQASAQPPEQGLEWHPCAAPFPVSATPMGEPADFPPGLECATLSVPLDHNRPDGERITIGKNRLQTLDPDQRVGSLVFNPGGPGGVATDFIALEALGASLFTPAVRQHFDLIGMDPRGVGASTPVRCDPAIWNDVVSWFPDDDDAFRGLQEHYRAFGESCLLRTGELLAHLDTNSAARDLELLRLALGEGSLNFLGLSYGSQLGTTYAELFPENIRVMVLDGALDHSQHASAMLADEAGAYEDAFDRFALWCESAPDCALHDQDVGVFFDDLVRRADAEPIPAPTCAEFGYCRATVTGEDIRFNVQGQIVIKDPLPGLGIPGWIGLAEMLAAAAAGDASGLSTEIADGDDFDGFAAQAIACVDWNPVSDSFADLSAKQLLGRVVAPHMQGATQTWTILLGCMEWPVPTTNPPHLVDIRDAPPILIVNATHDPSTAYVWAQSLRDQIKGSVLLTREGDGHTSYLVPGASRTRAAIDTYLVTGETPAPNTVFEE